jgi:hypothetical protein
MSDADTGRTKALKSMIFQPTDFGHTICFLSTFEKTPTHARSGEKAMRNMRCIPDVIPLLGAGLMACTLAGAQAASGEFFESMPPSQPPPIELSESRNDANFMSEPRHLGRFIEDVAINAAVRSELKLDQATEGIDISVTTYRGIVHLSGEVESEAQREHAVSVAISARGVYGVDDTALKIKGS